MAYYNEYQVKRAKQQVETYFANRPYKVVSYELDGETEWWEGSLENCQDWINCDYAEYLRKRDCVKMCVEKTTVIDALLYYNYGGFSGFNELLEKLSSQL